jgi:hypothetical protein
MLSRYVAVLTCGLASAATVSPAPECFSSSVAESLGWAQRLVTTGWKNKEGFESVPHPGARAYFADNDSARDVAKGVQLSLVEGNRLVPHIGAHEYLADNDSVRGTRAALLDHESPPEVASLSISEPVQLVLQKSEQLRGSLGHSEPEPVPPRHAWLVLGVIAANAALVAALRRYAAQFS